MNEPQNVHSFDESGSMEDGPTEAQGSAIPSQEELLKQAQKPPKETAIDLYSQLLPQFEAILHQMDSKKSMIRVLKNLVLAPLYITPLLSRKEAMLHTIMSKMLESKYVIEMSAMIEEQEENKNV